MAWAKKAMSPTGGASEAKSQMTFRGKSLTFDQLHDALSTEMQLQLESLRTKLYEATRLEKATLPGRLGWNI